MWVLPFSTIQKMSILNGMEDIWIYVEIIRGGFIQIMCIDHERHDVSFLFHEEINDGQESEIKEDDEF